MKYFYNKKEKNGSWTLSGAYLNYKSEGGGLCAEGWNEANKELEKESKEGE